ncbi:MAG: hypothetical protein ACRYG5_06070 [Janthinobacterium lividum]
MFALTTPAPGLLATMLNLTRGAQAMTSIPPPVPSSATPARAARAANAPEPHAQSTMNATATPASGVESSYQLTPMRAPPPTRLLDEAVIAYLRTGNGGAHLPDLAPGTVINLLHHQLFGNRPAPDTHRGFIGARASVTDALATQLMVHAEMFAGTASEPIDEAAQQHVLAQALVDLFDARFEDTRLGLIGYEFANDIKAGHTFAQMQANFIASLGSRFGGLTPQAAVWAARTLLHEYRPALLRADAQQLRFGSVACADLEAGIALAQASGIDPDSVDSRELSALARTGSEMLRGHDPAAGAMWYPQLPAALAHALANGRIDVQGFQSPSWSTLVDASVGLEQDRAKALSSMLKEIEVPVAELLQPFATRRGMALAQSATTPRPRPGVLDGHAPPGVAGPPLKGQRVAAPHGTSAVQQLAPPVDFDASQVQRTLDQRFEHHFTAQMKRYEQSIATLLGHALEGLASDDSDFLDNAASQISTIKLIMGMRHAPTGETRPSELIELREQVLWKAWRDGEVRHYLVRLLHADSLIMRLPDTPHDLTVLIRQQLPLFLSDATRARFQRYELLDVKLEAGEVHEDVGVDEMCEPIARLMSTHLYRLSAAAAGVPAPSQWPGLDTEQFTALAAYRPCMPAIGREIPGTEPAHCALAALAPGTSAKGNRLFRGGMFWRTETADDLAALQTRMMQYKPSQAAIYLAAKLGISLRASERLLLLAQPAARADVERTLTQIPAYRSGRQHWRLGATPLPSSSMASAASMLPLTSSRPVPLAEQLRDLETRGIVYRPDKRLWRAVQPPDTSSWRSGLMRGAPVYTLREVDGVDHVIVDCAGDATIEPHGGCERFAYRSPQSGLLSGPLLQPDAAQPHRRLYPLPGRPSQWPVSLAREAPHHRIREFHLPVNASVAYLPHFSQEFVDLAVFEIDRALYGLRLTDRQAPLESLTSILQRGEFRAAHCRAERGREDDMKCLTPIRTEVEGEPVILLTNHNNPIFQELVEGAAAALPASRYEQTYLYLNARDQSAARSGETVWYSNAYWRVEETPAGINLVQDHRTDAPAWPETLSATLVAAGAGAQRLWAVRFAGGDPRASQRAEVFRTFEHQHRQMGIIYADSNTLYAFELPALASGAPVVLRQADAALTESYRKQYRHRLSTLARGVNYHVQVAPRSRDVLIRVVNRYLGSRLGEYVIQRWRRGVPDAESRGEILVGALNPEGLPASRFHNRCEEFFDNEICNLLADETALKNFRVQLTDAFNQQQIGAGQSIGSIGIDHPRLPGILRELSSYFPHFNGAELPTRSGFGAAAKVLKRRFREAFVGKNVAYAELSFTDGARQVFAAPSGSARVEVQVASGLANFHNSLDDARATFRSATGNGQSLVAQLAREAQARGGVHYPASNENGAPHMRALDSEFLILRQIREYLRQHPEQVGQLSSLRLVTVLPPCHSCLISFIDFCMEHPSLRAELLDLNQSGSPLTSPVRDTAANPLQAALEARGAVGGAPAHAAHSDMSNQLARPTRAPSNRPHPSRGSKGDLKRSIPDHAASAL